MSVSRVLDETRIRTSAEMIAQLKASTMMFGPILLLYERQLKQCIEIVQKTFEIVLSESKDLNHHFFNFCAFKCSMIFWDNDMLNASPKCLICSGTMSSEVCKINAL